MSYFDKLQDLEYADRAILVGYDPKEDAMAQMCAASIKKHTNSNIPVVPIIRDYLLAYNVFNRPLDPRGSTQFSITRFLTPYLMGFKGVAWFIDCDFLITRNAVEVFDHFDPQYAVQVVKHNYKPKNENKMWNQTQHMYPCKNWSSSVLYNCSHHKNKYLTPEFVYDAHPSYLHQFVWLNNNEIGELPLEYNFLVEEYNKPDKTPLAVHYTLGCPLFRNRRNVDYTRLFDSEFEATFGRSITEEDLID